MKLILDTNILIADPRFEKAAFQALRSLCRARLCTLHIPELVRREFLSRRHDEIMRSAQQFKNAVGALTRQPASAGLKKNFAGLLTENRGLTARMLKNEELRVDRWLRTMRTRVIPAAAGHYDGAMDKYFKGQPPFATRRDRSNIPDAIILEAVRELAAGPDAVHFVVKDRRLREGAGHIPGVVTHVSLEDFVQHPAFREALSRIGAEQERLRRSPSLASLVRRQRPAVIRAAGILLASALDQSSLGLFPGAGSGFVEHPPEVLELSPEDGAGCYLGGDAFLMPFRARLRAECSFPLSRSEYAEWLEAVAEDAGGSVGSSHLSSLEMEFEVRGQLRFTVSEFQKGSRAVRDLLTGVQIDQLRPAE